MDEIYHGNITPRSLCTFTRLSLVTLHTETFEPIMSRKTGATILAGVWKTVIQRMLYTGNSYKMKKKKILLIYKWYERWKKTEISMKWIHKPEAIQNNRPPEIRNLPLQLQSTQFHCDGQMHSKPVSVSVQVPPFLQGVL